MKKLYLLLIFFLFPVSVFATNNNITVECPTEIKKDEEITCVVKAKSDIPLVSIELEYKLPEGIKQINQEIDSSWEGKAKENAFYLYTNKGKSDFNLGTITLKSTKEYKNVELIIEKHVIGDTNYEEHIIIDKTDVNNVETKKEKETEEKNNIFKYVIIIMIIGTIVVGFLIYKRTRSGKNEK